MGGLNLPVFLTLDIPRFFSPRYFVLIKEMWAEGQLLAEMEARASKLILQFSCLFFFFFFVETGTGSTDVWVNIMSPDFLYSTYIENGGI